MPPRLRLHVEIPDPRPPIDVAEAARLYVEEKLSLAAIGRRLGYRPRSIAVVLQKGKVARRPGAVRSHGKWGEEIYRVWILMREKCRGRTSSNARLYRARGIGIASDWAVFEDFHRWALSSGYKPGLRLALVDRGRDFSPENCQWVTAAEQVERRRAAHAYAVRRRLKAFGEAKGVAEWARDARCVVALNCLHSRLARGYRPEDAIGKTKEELAGCERMRTRKGRRRAEPGRIDEAEARRLYVDKGLSPPQVARRLGASYIGVIHLLHRIGVYRSGTRRVRTSRAARRLYVIWKHTWRSCTDPRIAAYRYVGQKGITICAAWREFTAFRDWALAAGYRPRLCLVRIHRGRGFSPGNCEWVTRAEVRRRVVPAKRSPPRARWTITAFGETRGPTAWERDPRCVVSMNTLVKRLRRGMTPEQAITTSRGWPGSYPVMLVRAFGETKGVAAWSKDRRCRVTMSGLLARLRRGIEAEVAITTRPHRLDEREERGSKRRWRARPRGRARK